MKHFEMTEQEYIQSLIYKDVLEQIDAEQKAYLYQIMANDLNVFERWCDLRDLATPEFHERVSQNDEEFMKTFKNYRRLEKKANRRRCKNLLRRSVRLRW